MFRRQPVVAATAWITLSAFSFTGVLCQPLQAAVSLARERSLSSPTLSSVVPPECGRVTGGAEAGGERLVIYIQDLHCQPDFQKNVYHILSAIDERRGIDRIFLEGAPSGKLDGSVFAAMPDGPVRRKTLQALLDRGLLGGAEYFAADRRREILFGLERWETYTRNLSAMRRLIGLRGTRKSIADRLAADVDALEERHLSARLYRRARQLRPDEAEDPAKRYLLLEKLASAAGEDTGLYEDFTACLKAQVLSRRVAPKRLNEELLRCSGELKARLPYDKYRRLSALAASGGPGPYLTALSRCADESGIDFSQRYPVLARYLSCLRLNGSINPLRLVREEARLSERIVARSAVSEKEREVLFLAAMGERFAEYAGLRMQPGDYRAFREKADLFRALLQQYLPYGAVEGVLSVLDDPLLVEFYGTNLRRDELFARTLAEAGNGGGRRGERDRYAAVDVVVAGGFHAGLMPLLRRQGISCLVVTPNAPSSYDDTVYTREIAGYAVQLPAQSALAPVFKGILSERCERLPEGAMRAIWRQYLDEMAEALAAAFAAENVSAEEAGAFIEAWKKGCPSLAGLSAERVSADRWEMTCGGRKIVFDNAGGKPRVTLANVPLGTQEELAAPADESELRAQEDRMREMYDAMAKNMGNAAAGQPLFVDAQVAKMRTMFPEPLPGRERRALETDIFSIVINDLPPDFVSYLEKVADEWRASLPESVRHYRVKPATYHVNLAVPQDLPKRWYEGRGVLVDRELKKDEEGRRREVEELKLDREELRGVFAAVLKAAKEGRRFSLKPYGVRLGTDGSLIFVFEFSPEVYGLRKGIIDGTKAVTPKFSGRPKNLIHVTLDRALDNCVPDEGTARRVREFDGELRRRGLPGPVTVDRFVFAHETRWMCEGHDYAAALELGKDNAGAAKSFEEFLDRYFPGDDGPSPRGGIRHAFAVLRGVVRALLRLPTRDARGRPINGAVDGMRLLAGIVWTVQLPLTMAAGVPPSPVSGTRQFRPPTVLVRQLVNRKALVPVVDQVFQDWQERFPVLYAQLPVYGIVDGEMHERVRERLSVLPEITVVLPDGGREKLGIYLRRRIIEVGRELGIAGIENETESKVAVMLYGSLLSSPAPHDVDIFAFFDGIAAEIHGFIPQGVRLEMPERAPPDMRGITTADANYSGTNLHLQHYIFRKKRLGENALRLYGSVDLGRMERREVFLDAEWLALKAWVENVRNPGPRCLNRLLEAGTVLGKIDPVAYEEARRLSGLYGASPDEAQGEIDKMEARLDGLRAGITGADGAYYLGEAANILRWVKESAPDEEPGKLLSRLADIYLLMDCFRRKKYRAKAVALLDAYKAGPVTRRQVEAEIARVGKELELASAGAEIAAGSARTAAAEGTEGAVVAAPQVKTLTRAAISRRVKTHGSEAVRDLWRYFLERYGDVEGIDLAAVEKERNFKLLWRNINSCVDMVLAPLLVALIAHDIGVGLLNFVFPLKLDSLGVIVPVAHFTGVVYLAYLFSFHQIDLSGVKARELAWLLRNAPYRRWFDAQPSSARTMEKLRAAGVNGYWDDPSWRKLYRAGEGRVESADGSRGRGSLVIACARLFIGTRDGKDDVRYGELAGSLRDGARTSRMLLARYGNVINAAREGTLTRSDALAFFTAVRMQVRPGTKGERVIESFIEGLSRKVYLSEGEYEVSVWARDPWTDLGAKDEYGCCAFLGGVNDAAAFGYLRNKSIACLDILAHNGRKVRAILGAGIAQDGDGRPGGVLIVDSVEGNAMVDPAVVRTAIEEYAEACGFGLVFYNRNVFNSVPEDFIESVRRGEAQLREMDLRLADDTRREYLESFGRNIVMERLPSSAQEVVSIFYPHSIHAWPRGSVVGYVVEVGARGTDGTVDERPVLEQVLPGQWRSVADEVMEVEQTFTPKLRESREDLEEVFTDAKCIVFVMRSAGRVVGYVAGGPLERYNSSLRGFGDDENFWKGNTAYIESIVLLPAFQGQGLGSDLRRAFLDEAARRGYRYVTAHHRVGVAGLRGDEIVASCSNWFNTGLVYEYSRTKLEQRTTAGTAPEAGPAVDRADGIRNAFVPPLYRPLLRLLERKGLSPSWAPTGVYLLDILAFGVLPLAFPALLFAAVPARALLFYLAGRGERSPSSTRERAGTWLPLVGAAVSLVAYGIAGQNWLTWTALLAGSIPSIVAVVQDPRLLLGFASGGRNREGFGFITGKLDATESAYRGELRDRLAQDGFSPEEADALSNAVVRLRRGSLELRGGFFSSEDAEKVLRRQWADLRRLVETVRREQADYRAAKDERGRQLFPEKVVHELLFRNLVPFALVEGLMKEGLSRTDASYVATGWSDPERQWRSVLRPVRDELIKEGLSRSDANRIVLKWGDPKETWEKLLRPVRDELVEDGLAPSEALHVVTTWSDPKGSWESVLKPARDALVRRGLSRNEATRIVMAWHDPQGTWEKERESVRDELMQDGLSRTTATAIVIGWSDPRETWERKIRPVRDALMADGLSRTNATFVATRWSDPLGTWEKTLKPLRDELVAAGLAKGDATRVVTTWSDPKGTWETVLRPLRDGLVAEGLSKTAATDIVTGWSDPKETWETVLKPARDALVRDGLSPSEATRIVLTWSDPLATWEKKLRPVRDELVSEGIAPSKATLLATSRREAKAFWEHVLRPAKEELVSVEGLTKTDALMLVTARRDPLAVWRTELRPVRDELVRRGLTRAEAAEIVLRWHDPLGTWEDRLKPLRDELIASGLSRSTAMRLVTSWSDPKGTWEKYLLPARDELEACGLSRSAATDIVTSWSDPAGTWQALQPLRDELTRSGLSTAKATFVVLRWRNPREKLRAVNAVLPAMAALLGMTEKAARYYVLSHGCAELDALLREKFGKSPVESRELLAPLLDYERDYGDRFLGQEERGDGRDRERLTGLVRLLAAGRLPEERPFTGEFEEGGYLYQIEGMPCPSSNGNEGRAFCSVRLFTIASGRKAPAGYLLLYPKRRGSALVRSLKAGHRATGAFEELEQALLAARPRRETRAFNIKSFANLFYYRGPALLREELRKNASLIEAFDATLQSLERERPGLFVSNPSGLEKALHDAGYAAGRHVAAHYRLLAHYRERGIGIPRRYRELSGRSGELPAFVRLIEELREKDATCGRLNEGNMEGLLVDSGFPVPFISAYSRLRGHYASLGCDIVERYRVLNAEKKSRLDAFIALFDELGEIEPASPLLNAANLEGVLRYSGEPVPYAGMYFRLYRHYRELGLDIAERYRALVAEGGGRIRALLELLEEAARADGGYRLLTVNHLTGTLSALGFPVRRSSLCFLLHRHYRGLGVTIEERFERIRAHSNGSVEAFVRLFDELKTLDPSFSLLTPRILEGALVDRGCALYRAAGAASLYLRGRERGIDPVERYTELLGRGRSRFEAFAVLIDELRAADGEHAAFNTGDLEVLLNGFGIGVRYINADYRLYRGFLERGADIPALYAELREKGNDFEAFSALVEKLKSIGGDGLRVNTSGLAGLLAYAGFDVKYFGTLYRIDDWWKERGFDVVREFDAGLAEGNSSAGEIAALAERARRTGLPGGDLSMPAGSYVRYLLAHCGRIEGARQAAISLDAVQGLVPSGERTVATDPDGIALALSELRGRGKLEKAEHAAALLLLRGYEKDELAEELDLDGDAVELLLQGLGAKLVACGLFSLPRERRADGDLPGEGPGEVRRCVDGIIAIAQEKNYTDEELEKDAQARELFDRVVEQGGGAMPALGLELEARCARADMDGVDVVTSMAASIDTALAVRRILAALERETLPVPVRRRLVAILMLIEAEEGSLGYCLEAEPALKGSFFAALLPLLSDEGKTAGSLGEEDLLTERFLGLALGAAVTDDDASELLRLLARPGLSDPARTAVLAALGATRVDAAWEGLAAGIAALTDDRAGMVATMLFASADARAYLAAHPGRLDRFLDGLCRRLRDERGAVRADLADHPELLRALLKAGPLARDRMRGDQALAAAVAAQLREKALDKDTDDALADGLADLLYEWMLFSSPAEKKEFASPAAARERYIAERERMADLFVALKAFVEENGALSYAELMKGIGERLQVDVAALSLPARARLEAGVIRYLRRSGAVNETLSAIERYGIDDAADNYLEENEGLRGIFEEFFGFLPRALQLHVLPGSLYFVLDPGSYARFNYLQMEGKQAAEGELEPGIAERYARSSGIMYGTLRRNFAGRDITKIALFSRDDTPETLRHEWQHRLFSTYMEDGIRGSLLRAGGNRYHDPALRRRETLRRMTGVLLLQYQSEIIANIADGDWRRTRDRLHWFASYRPTYEAHLKELFDDDQQLRDEAFSLAWERIVPHLARIDALLRLKTRQLFVRGGGARLTDPSARAVVEAHAALLADEWVASLLQMVPVTRFDRLGLCVARFERVASGQAFGALSLGLERFIEAVGGEAKDMAALSRLIARQFAGERGHALPPAASSRALQLKQAFVAQAALAGLGDLSSENFEVRVSAGEGLFRRVDGTVCGVPVFLAQEEGRYVLSIHKGYLNALHDVPEATARSLKERFGRGHVEEFAIEEMKEFAVVCAAVRGGVRPLDAYRKHHALSPHDRFFVSLAESLAEASLPADGTAGTAQRYATAAGRWKAAEEQLSFEGIPEMNVKGDTFYALQEQAARFLEPLVKKDINRARGQDRTLVYVLSAGQRADVGWLLRTLELHIPRGEAKEWKIVLFVTNAQDSALQAAAEEAAESSLPVQLHCLRLNFFDPAHVRALESVVEKAGLAGTVDGLLHNMGGVSHAAAEKGYLRFLRRLAKEGAWLETDAIKRPVRLGGEEVAYRDFVAGAGFVFRKAGADICVFTAKEPRQSLLPVVRRTLGAALRVKDWAGRGAFLLGIRTAGRERLQGKAALLVALPGEEEEAVRRAGEMAKEGARPVLVRWAQPEERQAGGTVLSVEVNGKPLAAAAWSFEENGVPVLAVAPVETQDGQAGAQSAEGEELAERIRENADRGLAADEVADFLACCGAGIAAKAGEVDGPGRLVDRQVGALVGLENRELGLRVSRRLELLPGGKRIVFDWIGRSTVASFLNALEERFLFRQAVAGGEMTAGEHGEARRARIVLALDHWAAGGMAGIERLAGGSKDLDAVVAAVGMPLEQGTAAGFVVDPLAIDWRRAAARLRVMEGVRGNSEAETALALLEEAARSGDAESPDGTLSPASLEARRQEVLALMRTVFLAVHGPDAAQAQRKMEQGFPAERVTLLREMAARAMQENPAAPQEIVLWEFVGLTALAQLQGAAERMRRRGTGFAVDLGGIPGEGMEARVEETAWLMELCGGARIDLTGLEERGLAGAFLEELHRRRIPKDALLIVRASAALAPLIARLGARREEGIAPGDLRQGSFAAQAATGALLGMTLTGKESPAELEAVIAAAGTSDASGLLLRLAGRRDGALRRIRAFEPEGDGTLDIAALLAGFMREEPLTPEAAFASGLRAGRAVMHTRTDAAVVLRSLLSVAEDGRPLLAKAMELLEEGARSGRPQGAEQAAAGVIALLGKTLPAGVLAGFEDARGGMETTGSGLQRSARLYEMMGLLHGLAGGAARTTADRAVLSEEDEELPLLELLLAGGILARARGAGSVAEEEGGEYALLAREWEAAGNRAMTDERVDWFLRHIRAFAIEALPFSGPGVSHSPASVAAVTAMLRELRALRERHDYGGALRQATGAASLEALRMMQAAS